MNFGERSRGIARNTLTIGAAAAAAAGIYYGRDALSEIDHSQRGVQSSTVGEPKREYFADFTIDGTKIELTTVLASQGIGDGMRYITVWGRAPKDPSASISREGWEFKIALGSESYDARLSVLPAQSGSNAPLEVVIIASVPETLQVDRIDITHDVPNSESQNGGVGDSFIQTIPLPISGKSQK